MSKKKEATSQIPSLAHAHSAQIIPTDRSKIDRFHRTGLCRLISGATLLADI
ncbi:hypothetical protein J6590_083941 [Homalodisca vitripennis]|nr:hypothetical protein J6590_083941 [Homalodisca vitripennis]